MVRISLMLSFIVLIIASLALAVVAILNREWGTTTASISLLIAVISGWIAYETFYTQNLAKKPQLILSLDFKSRYDLIQLSLKSRLRDIAYRGSHHSWRANRPRRNDRNCRRPHDLKFPPVRKYQVLTLNGNKEDDNIKLDFARITIREMLAMNDTINGVRVHFSDTARYESFVRALDICNRERELTYVPLKVTYGS